MKRQLATEWLIEQIEQSLLTVGYSGTKNKLRILKEQAKQKEIDNLEGTYCDGRFDYIEKKIIPSKQYIKETFKSEQ